jgi:hypothetical protein
VLSGNTRILARDEHEEDDHGKDSMKKEKEDERLQAKEQPAPGTQFTCFTSTKVQLLTPRVPALTDCQVIKVIKPRIKGQVMVN